MKKSLIPKPPNRTSVVLKYYWSILRLQPFYMTGALLALPVTIVVNSFIPSIIVAETLSRLSQESAGASLSSLWPNYGSLILAYTATVLIGILTWRLVDYFMWRLEIKNQQKIAEDVFQNLLSRSTDFHANNFGGSLVSQSNKLLSSYVRMSDATIFQVYPMIVGIIATIIIMLPKSPAFVLALIILTIIHIVVAIVISKPIRKKAAKWAAAESRQTGFLADAITNILTIKSFAATSFEKRRFHKATARTRNHAFGFARKHQLQMTSFGLVGRTIQSVSFFLAIVAVLAWKSDISVVFLIVSYTSYITEHLFRFGNDSMRAYNRSIGDAYDMAKILSETPEILDPTNPEPNKINRGEIAIRDVNFTHSDAKDPIFSGLTLDIKSGEKIGLVGHSGSGKTTFTRLLMRFSDLDSGAILIDGQNIAHITQDDLHKSIAFVPQEPMLFHRTLAENIAYGKTGASLSEINEAAKMANASEFIDDLPEGLNTLVGERGIKLSGGQRQRIAIARAMLKDAPILVLDEATSALDSESEALIQKALWKLMEGRTTIAIAHRLSTIQRMDRIVVLEKGKIVEIGSHKQLLAKDGKYAKLWARQSGGFIEE